MKFKYYLFFFFSCLLATAVKTHAQIRLQAPKPNSDVVPSNYYHNYQFISSRGCITTNFYVGDTISNTNTNGGGFNACGAPSNATLNKLAILPTAAAQIRSPENLTTYWAQVTDPNGNFVSSSKTCQRIGPVTYVWGKLQSFSIQTPGTYTIGFVNDSKTVDITILNRPSIVPSVSIMSDAVGNAATTGTPVTFTANIANEGTYTNSYKWYVNNRAVGGNTAVYTTSTLNDNDVVNCILSTKIDACSDFIYNSSQSLTMKISPICTPTSANTNTTICSNQLPYAWNGQSITDAGTYQAISTNAEGCDHTENLVLTITTPVTPLVSITADPGNSITTGTSVTFTATPTNEGTAPVYQWKKNGNNVGSNSATYTDATLQNGDIITCELTSSEACLSTTTATSPGITMTVAALPSITTTSALSAFAACSGAASAEQSFTVSGANLVGNLLVTAPTGFELSTSSGSDFTASITLIQSGGLVALSTVYVRLAVASSGTPTGDITFESNGAITQNLAVSGTVNTTLTPTFATVAAICFGATLTDLPTTSLEGIAGTWSPALNNLATTTYTFTPAEGQCATTASMTITVNTTAAPIGSRSSNQMFSGGATLASLTMTGTAIKWYSAASGGSVLPISTALVDGRTYYASQTIDGCESSRTAVSVNMEIPTSFNYCRFTRVATPVGNSTLKFYYFATGSSALSPRTRLTSRTYFVTQLINGVESSPRVPVAVTVNELPIRVVAITASNTNLCRFIGTNETVTYTATSGASSYIWTVPTGVTIRGGQGTNILTVDFHTTTTAGAAKIGSIGVTAVNGTGCSSTTARTNALSTKLPTAPSRATLTYNGVGQTSVGTFIGEPTKTLVLAASDNSNTASSYTWELPAGVTVVNGDAATDRSITIHLGGVVRGTSNLVFKAYSVAGCGRSEAVSLTVTRALPGSPRALLLTDDTISSVNPILNVQGYTGKFKTTPLTLTAAPRTGNDDESTSYKWILPSGIGIVDASATFVSQEAGFTTYTSTSNVIKINLSAVGSATSMLLKVFGVNGNGTSQVSRDLTLRSAVPAKSGMLTTASGGRSVTYHPSCRTISVKVPNVFGVSNDWEVRSGAARIVGTNNDGNEATIDVSALPTEARSSFVIAVIASNGTGTTSTLYTIRLGSACSVGKIKSNDNTTAKVTNEFKVIAYPNPSSNVFTIKIQSLDKTKKELSVYDTAGRLVEKLQAQTNEVDLGSKYPAGVYNVMVKQGENVKTVRVVKK